MKLRLRVSGLAGLISRQPLRVAIIAIVIGALGATGLIRFSVNAGQSLLVGANSAAGSTYASFSNTFGSDPIVLVFTSKNPSAPYLERNLERLGALEIDLAHDPRVSSVLGSGTVAGSLRQAAVAEVNNVLTEYPYFIAETDYLEQLQMGNSNQQDLQSKVQSDISNAQKLLALYVVKAASDAHNTRQQFKQQSTDKVLDSREKAVDAAVAMDSVPPLWAEYLAGPGQQTNQPAAQQFFDRVASAYGDCDETIANLLQIQPSCQIYFERALLDLPNCPPASSHQFCDPKPQWSSVLPPPAQGTTCPGGLGGVPCSYEIVTIRLKPQYVGDQGAISSLQDKINSELQHGIASDSYTQQLTSANFNNLKALGPLVPTECGGQTAQQDQACVSAFTGNNCPAALKNGNDCSFGRVMAGAPLLGLGIVTSMTQLLPILFAVGIFVMLLILVGFFRVRGRAWPLLAAGAATILTFGISLWTGTPITPAVLAGVPVLVGLGVDYAVQLIARFYEERRASTPSDEAVRHVIENSGRATLVAAIATLAGLAALALFSGIDWGPLVAVPLVAEFALVLCGGVILAWLGGLFIALPLVVWSDRRRSIELDAEPKPRFARRRETKPAERTLAIADSWRGVVALASLLAVAGWIALHFVPVQTDPQRLVSPSLQAYKDVLTVQDQTGYTNEIDVALHGQVATGPIDNATGNPSDVEWQCGVASVIRSTHSDVVAAATSIGDYLIASGSGPSGSNAAACVPAPSPSGSPSPSPSASPSPGAASPSPSPAASASPTSERASAEGAVTAAQVQPFPVAQAPSPTPSPAPTASGSAIPSPLPSGKASPSASPSPSQGAAPATQTTFLCNLRLLPLLSRTLVMDISPDTQACPAVDKYQDVFLTKDATPIDPNSGRIVIGVHTNSVADQSKLVNSIRSDIANPPNGMTAAPTGVAVLATTAYDNLVNRSYLLNLAPLAVVAIALYLIYREPRRALLPLLPTVLAAGWAPLVLLLLGRLPGGIGQTLGSLNPLTVVLGALVIALGTEFGVMLLSRFYEERRRGLDPDAAAAAALGGVGRAIRVSALTLGAGFAVLAISGLFPNSFPLIADFGLAVVIDLALAVGAVFLVMLPVAVALERRSPLQLARVETPSPAPAAEPSPPQAKPRPRRGGRRPKPATRADETPAIVDDTPAAEPERKEPAAEPSEQPTPGSRRMPGVSGRRRIQRPEEPATEEPAEEAPRRRPGVSGRRRGKQPGS
ncbi:MAG: MMPL family transporter [Candidatus Dormibacteria bacterium]